jgi:dTDP-4-dehydrorhamnose reductase
MSKRLLVTGANGFVGGSVVTQAGPQWDVHVMLRKDVQFPRDGVIRHTFDLSDFARLHEAFGEAKPDVVIHAAALADIDFCEKNRDIAETVNVGVTRELARLCRESGARMIHLSTDTVFDGKQGMRREDDPVGPVNFYGETKVRAENTVMEEIENHVIARLAIVMGLPFVGGGNSFLSRMIATLQAGKEAGFPDNEIRTPVDVVTLGRALPELAENDFRGILHLAGNDCLNRFELARRIAKQMGLPVELIVMKNAVASPDRAPRPVDISLDNSKAREVLRTPMQGLESGLELVLSTSKGASA